MLFQLHQNTKNNHAAVEAYLNFLAKLIDVHCSRHLKNKNNFFIPTPIKIMQLTLFFFISFILSHRVLSSSLSSSHNLSHLSSSHLSHLPAHTVAVPAQPMPSTFHAIPAHAVCQALISLIKLSSPSPRCRHPSPRLSPRRPSQSTLGQCSLFFCSEFFSSGCLLFWLNFSGFGVILW